MHVQLRMDGEHSRCHTRSDMAEAKCWAAGRAGRTSELSAAVMRTPCERLGRICHIPKPSNLS